MTAQTNHPFQVMAKPIGPRCNLDCKYCYYLEKERLYPETKRFEMKQDVLEAYIRDYIASQEGMPGDEIWFNWQGGEPTILGVDYFRRIVALQKQYRRSGKRIRNALQTNGTLLDKDWAEFFKAHDFLIGLSLDGPEALHDGYRVDRAGRPSYATLVLSISSLSPLSNAAPMVKHWPLLPRLTRTAWTISSRHGAFCRVPMGHSYAQCSMNG